MRTYGQDMIATISTNINYLALKPPSNKSQFHIPSSNQQLQPSFHTTYISHNQPTFFNEKLNTNISSPNYDVSTEPQWFSNLEARHHITSDIHHLTAPQTYTGVEKLME